MSMIWLVGAQDPWTHEYADVLSGFFAVRRISSLRNFKRLLMLNEAPRSGEFMCILRISEAEDLIELHAALSEFLAIFNRFSIYVVGEALADHKMLLQGLGIAFLGVPVDIVESAKLLRRMIEGGSEKVLVDVLNSSIRIGDIEIDREAARMRVLATGFDEPLTPKEIRIFQVLSTSVNKTISRDELVKKVWPGIRVSASTVDSHISRLRKKIDQSFECRLETNYGTGWTLAIRVEGSF